MVIHSAYWLVCLFVRFLSPPIFPFLYFVSANNYKYTVHSNVNRACLDRLRELGCEIFHYPEGKVVTVLYGARFMFPLCSSTSLCWEESPCTDLPLTLLSPPCSIELNHFLSSLFLSQNMGPHSGCCGALQWQQTLRWTDSWSGT